MTKRRLVWVVAVCLALVVGLLAWRASRPHPVNRANFERIQKGMTQAEVEAILGCPPGGYATVDYWGPLSFKRHGSAVIWISNEEEAWVWFDDNGRVSEASFGELVAIKRSGLLDRLRTWLGW